MAGFILKSLMDQRNTVRQATLQLRAKLMVESRTELQTFRDKWLDFCKGMHVYGVVDKETRIPDDPPAKPIPFPESLRSITRENLYDTGQLRGLQFWVDDRNADYKNRVSSRIPLKEYMKMCFHILDLADDCIDEINQQLGVSTRRGLAALPGMVRTVWRWAFIDFWKSCKRVYKLTMDPVHIVDFRLRDAAEIKQATANMLVARYNKKRFSRVTIHRERKTDPKLGDQSSK